MKCYYHPDREAVAVCSVCGKPLCAECAHEYKGKIYCKECLAKVKEEEKAAASKSNVSKSDASQSAASESVVSENTETSSAESKAEEKVPYKGVSTAKVVFTSIVVALVIIGLILLSTMGISGVLTPLAFVTSKSSRVESVTAIPYEGEQIITVSLDANNCALNVKEVEKAIDDKIIKENAEGAKLSELTSVNAVARMSYKNGALTVKATGLKKNAVVNLYLTSRIKEISLELGGKNASFSVELPDIPMSAKLSLTNGNVSLLNCTVDRISGTIMNGSVNIKNSRVTGINLKGMNSQISFISNKFLGSVSLNLLNGMLNVNGNKRITSFYEKGVNSEINCDFSETEPPMSATFKNITTEVTIDVGKQPAVISAPYADVKADSYFTVNGSNYTTPNYSEQSSCLDISVLPAGETAIPLGSITLLGGD